MPCNEALDRAFSESFLITMNETEQLLNIDPKTLRRHVANGDLGCRTIGQGISRPRLRFGRDDIEAFLERRKRQPSGPMSVVPALKAHPVSVNTGATIPSFSELQRQRAGATAKR